MCSAKDRNTKRTISRNPSLAKSVSRNVDYWVLGKRFSRTFDSVSAVGHQATCEVERRSESADRTVLYRVSAVCDPARNTQLPIPCRSSRTRTKPFFIFPESFKSRPKGTGVQEAVSKVHVAQPAVTSSIYDTLHQSKHRLIKTSKIS